MDSDFTKWCLWSRNQKDQPQGVISHNSALALYGILPYNSQKVHLTVPPRFRKEIPGEVVIHKASLNLSAIESHDSFMVTRLGQTLVDMRPELEAKGEWDGIIMKVVAEDRLSHEEMINCGILSTPKIVSDDKLCMESSSGQIGLGMFKQTIEQIETQSSKGCVSDPVAERVWKMMYNRAEVGRRRSQAGFTLVELLAVVAIISILASLLMPSLSKAREAARKLACASNQKQIGVLSFMYTDMYGGWVTWAGGMTPHTGTRAEPGWYKYPPSNNWLNKLLVIAGLTPEYDIAGSDVNDPVNWGKGIFLCAEKDRKKLASENFWSGGYTLNQYLVGCYWGDDCYTHLTTIGQIKNPSVKIYLMETHDEGMNPFVMYNWTIPGRHPNSGYALCFDGHVMLVDDDTTTLQSTWPYWKGKWTEWIAP